MTADTETTVETVEDLLARGDQLRHLSDYWGTEQRYDRAATCAAMATACYSAVVARTALERRTTA